MFIHMQIDILDILFINFPFAQFEKRVTELLISPRLRFCIYSGSMSCFRSNTRSDGPAIVGRSTHVVFIYSGSMSCLLTWL